MCGLVLCLKIKCNCFCQTIHIEGCPLPLAITKWDFVFSLSYGLRADKLSLLTHYVSCLCPGPDFWRGQLLCHCCPSSERCFLGMPFGGDVQNQLFHCASSICSWQVFLPAASGCYWLPPLRSREDMPASGWFWFSRDLCGFWCLKGIRKELHKLPLGFDLAFIETRYRTCSAGYFISALIWIERLSITFKCVIFTNKMLVRIT